MSIQTQGFPEEEGDVEGWRKPRVTLRHVEGSPGHSGTLKEAGVAEADAVIVGSAYSKDGKEVRRAALGFVIRVRARITSGLG